MDNKVFTVSLVASCGIFKKLYSYLNLCLIFKYTMPVQLEILKMEIVELGIFFFCSDLIYKL